MRVVLRPRAARVAGYAIGGLVLLGSIILGALTAREFGVVSTVLFVVFGLLIFWFCHREASVSVTATHRSLTVRNLMSERSLEWAEVLGVSFPVGNPWAHLDLADGDTLSVMAIQRTDGEHGLALARRLQGLIREHGEGVAAAGEG